MRCFLAPFALGVAALGVMLASAGPSRAQDIFIPPPPPPTAPPPPPFIDANNNGPGLGNILFDRWIDNRRGTRSTPYHGTTARPMYVQPAPDNTVRIRIALPAAAKVWFDDQATKQTGAVRYFRTPPLPPGEDYTYAIKAQWRDPNGKEVTETRQVAVRANATVRVDFAAAKK